MPMVIPFIPLIAAAASTGTTIGMDLAGVGQPSPNAYKGQMLAQEEAAQKQQQTSEQAAFKKFAPDAQAQTGGALADPSLAAMIAEFAGAPADVNLAQSTVFGPQSQGLSSSGLQVG